MCISWLDWEIPGSGAEPCLQPYEPVPPFTALLLKDSSNCPGSQCCLMSSPHPTASVQRGPHSWAQQAVAVWMKIPPGTSMCRFRGSAGGLSQGLWAARWRSTPMDTRAASPWRDRRAGQGRSSAAWLLGSDRPWVGQLGHCPYSSFLPSIIF